MRTKASSVKSPASPIVGEKPKKPHPRKTAGTKGHKKTAKQIAVRKNTPLHGNTEVNDQAKGRLYRGARLTSGVENLPIKTIPLHLQADKGDETTLEAAYARLGVGDIDFSRDRDGRNLKTQADKSKGSRT